MASVPVVPSVFLLSLVAIEAGIWDSKCDAPLVTEGGENASIYIINNFLHSIHFGSKASCPLDMLWQTLKGQGDVFPSKPSLAPLPADTGTQLSGPAATALLHCTITQSHFFSPKTSEFDHPFLLLSQGWGDAALNIHTASMTRAGNRPHRVQAMWLPSISAVWKCGSDPSSTPHTKNED